MRSVVSTIAINTAIAAVPALAYLWFSDAPRWPVAWSAFGWSAVYANVIGFMAAYVFPRLIPRFKAFRGPLQWAFIVGTLLVLALAGSTLASGILFAVVGAFPGSSFAGVWKNSSKMSVALTLTFGIGVVVYHQNRHRLEETTLALRTRELEKERAITLATEARLQSLESRIHPHFLFNALNSVSALIREQPDLAEQQVERIARFLRFALDRGSERLVSLSDELRTVSDYLEIEKTRFGRRLRYDVQMPQEALDVHVPPMSVQTLVENSVKYAIAPRIEGGTIRVTGSVADGRLSLKVHDDGPGFDAALLPSGHGLDLLNSRLAAQFGDRAMLKFRNGEGLTATLVIPCACS